MIVINRICVGTLLLLGGGFSILRGMDTPPPHCITDQAKAEYAALCAVLLSADTQKINEHIKRYNVDLNSRCMNIWTKRVHHPTYPIEWIIQKMYTHECIHALLKLGVPAQGYNDYTPLVDLVVSDMNSIECIRVLYMYGADPNMAGLDREKRSHIPLDYVRACKRIIPENSVFKADVTKLKRFNEIETLLSSARPERPQEPVIPQVTPVQAGGPQLSNPHSPNTQTRTLLTPIRGMFLGIVVCGIVYAVYKKYYAENKKDGEEEKQEAQQNDQVNGGSDEIT